jgi:hypothetical protein
MSEAREQYAADFKAMTDKEIEEESERCRNKVDHSSENARLVEALTEAEISLKAIGHPQPNDDPPDAHICGVIARSALIRIEQRRRTQ